ncbi:MAG: sigma-70 family RNA polymerase sigma factor [Acidimicrobiia bacterium]|nr:sigma-70 family RNA polymerase sigma factor [Acidimicrobiia bacterium]
MAEYDTDSAVADSDQELVAMAQEGDLEAFGVLVRRHQGFVFGVILRVVKNRSTAEDLAQDTFLRAFKNLNGFRGDAQVRSWLYRIGNNLAINHVTRNRENPTEVVPERSTGRSTARSAEQRDLKEAMEAAIAELPEDLRRPLVMREYEHCSYEHIAYELDVPLNTIRTRIFRAKRALQGSLEEWR